MKYSDNVLEIAKQLLMKKAEDVRVINVSDLTIIADYFVIASGRSDVHVKSLCDEVQKYMFEAGASQLRLEGYREGRWIVVDYGDILIHIFHRNEREFYGLERLWTDGTNSLQITEEMMTDKIGVSK